MSDEVIRPYQGPPILSGGSFASPEEKAAAMAHDAVLFSQADSQLTQAITNPGATKGRVALDGVTANNLREIRNQIRTSPPSPATIINLHPWRLSFPAGDVLMRGIEVPACNPGEHMVWTYVRKAKHQHFYAENGESRNFRIVTPLELAGEFVREYSNPAADGGGVIIVKGEHNPEKLYRDNTAVEVFDQTGKPITSTGLIDDFDDHDRPIKVAGQVPVLRPFRELVDEAIKLRDDIYLGKVQETDADFSSPDSRRKIEKGRLMRCRLMAEVLFAQGRITKVPEWNLATRLEEGLMDENCPSCSSPRKQGSYKCSNCGNILDALAAYKDHAIEFEHAKMESLTTEELAEAIEIKLARDKMAEQREKLMAKIEKKAAKKSANSTDDADGVQE